MSNTEHSWFSPSAAHRTIPCPGSVKLAASLPNPDSDHSRSGTECHTAMEFAVTFETEEFAPTDFTINPASQVELCQIAMGSLKELIEANGLTMRDIVTESKVDLGEYGHPDIFGTCDVLAYNPETKRLLVIDYKFGYNPVNPVNNPQLMIYGLAGRALYPDAQEILLGVIQPQESRMANCWVTDKDHLIYWYNETLAPAIEAAKSDDAPLNPGEDQCKYCPVSKVGCSAQTGKYLDAIENFNPAEAHQLNDEKLLELANMIPGMKDAIKAVEVATVARLKLGSQTLRGSFKLVERQTKRKWADAEEAEAFLKAKRFKQSQYQKTSVITPTQAEKLMKTKRFAKKVHEEFGELITKPKGELTYAPLTDKRKPVEINEVAALDADQLEDLL